MDWIPFVVVPLVVVGVIMLKVKDIRNKQLNPPRKWEGKPDSDNERRWHDAEKESARKAGGMGGDM